MQQYVIGIDLGTSHCALSYWQKGEKNRDLSILDIGQYIGKNHWKDRSVLASVVYLPYEKEQEELKDTSLPWGGDSSVVVGQWAKERGIDLPERCINSAKSWLCHNKVDRNKKILPWNSDVTTKFSPIEITEIFANYLKQCFLHSQQKSQETQVDLENSEVVVTVPASFDEVARSLTLEAAIKVGFKNVSVLEEPQAALYSWVVHNHKVWKEHISSGDIILVCDVGGGTSDFSLILVNEKEGNLELNRLSVGRHLLLGGDNMDLALAYFARSELQSIGHSLDQWQFRSLVHSCRDAKEKLMSDLSIESIPLTIESKGSNLFASTIVFELKRTVLEQIVVDGFFPEVNHEQRPKRQQTVGLQEFGLNYESDAAISKHLAEYLAQSYQQLSSLKDVQDQIDTNLLNKMNENSFVFPTKVLFNGGVFKSDRLRSRVMTLLQRWFDEIHAGSTDSTNSIEELQGNNFELSVAYGACFLARSKHEGEGVRIASGLSRSYYLGIESGGMAIPGVTPAIKGLCIAPQGAVDGETFAMTEQMFALMVGQKAVFKFFSSPNRSGDIFGQLVENADDELEETADLEVTLRADHGGENSDLSSMDSTVPVYLESEVTDIGTLQIYMKNPRNEEKWKLEFNIRPQY